MGGEKGNLSMRMLTAGLASMKILISTSYVIYTVLYLDIACVKTVFLDFAVNVTFEKRGERYSYICV